MTSFKQADSSSMKLGLKPETLLRQPLLLPQLPEYMLESLFRGDHAAGSVVGSAHLRADSSWLSSVARQTTVIFWGRISIHPLHA